MDADDDPVDAKPEIEEKCRPTCSKFWGEYEACITRVEKDTTGEAHCSGQYLDFWKCIDKCAIPKLFATLK